MLTGSRQWEWRIKATPQENHPRVERRHRSLECIKRVCENRWPTKEIINRNLYWGWETIFFHFSHLRRVWNKAAAEANVLLLFLQITFSQDNKWDSTFFFFLFFFLNYLHNKQQHSAAAFKLYFQYLPRLWTDNV